MDRTPRVFLALPALPGRVGLFAAIVAAEAAIAALYEMFVSPLSKTFDGWGAEFFVLLLLLSLLVAFAPYPLVLVCRSLAYPTLWGDATAADAARDAMKAKDELLSRLLSKSEGLPLLTIRGVLREGATVRLILDHRPEVALGSELICIELTTFTPVGRFTVSSVQSTRCLASEVSIIDGLWWGAIHQRAAEGDLEAPADTAALLMMPGGRGTR